MIEDKSVVAIIPARGGSKGLPGKNIRELCGKPLIAWTIERALGSRHVDRVIVSTDSEEIAQISRRYGAEVPFMRPAAFATDEASSYQVIAHAIGHYHRENLSFDYTVLLEPTSPLREESDIDRMIELLHDTRERHDGVVSVGPISESPTAMKRLADDRLEPYWSDLPQATRRQESEPAYFPYGVAYIAKTAVLLDKNTFYLPTTTWYEVQRYQTYEIDDVYDFICVEAVMKHQWGM